jgi:hypothetical protein
LIYCYSDVFNLNGDGKGLVSIDLATVINPDFSIDLNVDLRLTRHHQRNPLHFGVFALWLTQTLGAGLQAHLGVVPALAYPNKRLLFNILMHEPDDSCFLFPGLVRVKMEFHSN